MENVVKFPAKTIRDKIQFEKTIRQRLSKTDLDQKTVDEIIERLIPLWDIYQYRFKVDIQIPFPDYISETDKEKISSSINELFKNFEGQLHNFISSLLLERVEAEITIYLAGH